MRPGWAAAAAVCVAVVALYWAQEFLKPLALAVLLSFVLAPASRWLERTLRFPRVVSVIAVVVLAAGLVACVGWVVTSQVRQLAGEAATYRANVERRIDTVRELSGGVLERMSRAARGLRGSVGGGDGRGAGATAVPGPGPSPRAVSRPAAEARPEATGDEEGGGGGWVGVSGLLGIGGGVLSVLATVAIVAVYVVFMLIHREDMRDRLISLLSSRGGVAWDGGGRERGRGGIGMTTEALDDATARVSRYLLMLCVVNGTYGMAVAVALWGIGVPAAALWGLLCALFRFVPYVGPWIGAAFPILLSFGVGPDWTMPLLTLGLFVVLEAVSNNVMEPWLYGRGTGVSPMAVIISAVFWTWLWGTPGLLMATPLMVCAAVAGKHVERLRFLAVVLGDEPALEVHQRYYQRLLAGDAEESAELLDRAAREAEGEGESGGGLLGAYEEVVLPALIAAEREARRGGLTPEKFDEAMTLLRLQIDRLAERHRAARVVRLAQGQTSEVPTAAYGADDARESGIADQSPKALSPAGRSSAGAVSESASAAASTESSGVAVTASASRIGERTRGASGGSGGKLLSRRYVALPVLPTGVRPRVLVLPARDVPDELAGRMLAHVLSEAGYDATCMSIASLAGEMVESAVRSRPDLVVVSATPPISVGHARYLLKRLAQATARQDAEEPQGIATDRIERRRLAADRHETDRPGGADGGDDGKGGPAVMTALWSRSADPRRLARRVSPGEPLHMTTTLTTAAERVRQLTAGAAKRLAMAANRSDEPGRPGAEGGRTAVEGGTAAIVGDAAELEEKTRGRDAPATGR